MVLLGNFALSLKPRPSQILPLFRYFRPIKMHRRAVLHFDWSNLQRTRTGELENLRWPSALKHLKLRNFVIEGVACQLPTMQATPLLQTSLISNSIKVKFWKKGAWLLNSRNTYKGRNILHLNPRSPNFFQKS